MLATADSGKSVLARTDAINLLQALPDGSIDLLLTDIPYENVDKPTGGLRILDKEQANRLDFDLIDFAREAMRVARQNIVIFCGKEQISPLYRLFDAEGLTTRLLIWEKTNPMPMNSTHVFLSGIEAAVYARKPWAAFNSTYRNTVFRYPSGSSLRHPTEKPQALFKELITLLSNPGDLVLDPCLGSGTTATAALATNRRFIAGDHDQDCIDTSIGRLLAATQQPRLLL